MSNKQGKPKKYLFAPGHSGCAGCGEMIAARHVVDAAGPDTIIANATGCLEVTSSKYPQSAWAVPWIHSVFENPAAIASGIIAALKRKGLADKINVIAQGGDGGSYDIGFGLISGMWERRENILYVCYNNEDYMNTGVQASGATPYNASTTTTPAGKKSMGSDLFRKNMSAIAVAHGLPYVATSTSAFPLDIQKKVRKALSIKGPKYLEILVGCVPGWGYNSKLTVKICKLAQQTGLFPVWEAENGKITSAMKVPAKPPKVEKYLELQKRFIHLFKGQQGKKQIKFIQSLADDNIRQFGLCAKCTEHTVMTHRKL